MTRTEEPTQPADDTEETKIEAALTLLEQWIEKEKELAKHEYQQLAEQVRSMNRMTNQTYQPMEAQRGRYLSLRLQSLEAVSSNLWAVSCGTEMLFDGEQGVDYYSLHHQPEANATSRDFVLPLLHELWLAGGVAPLADLLRQLRENLGAQLCPADIVEYSRIALVHDKRRWQNMVHAARRLMLREGYLEHGSPRGVWAISHTGVKMVEDTVAQSENGI